MGIYYISMNSLNCNNNINSQKDNVKEKLNSQNNSEIKSQKDNINEEINSQNNSEIKSQNESEIKSQMSIKDSNIILIGKSLQKIIRQKDFCVDSEAIYFKKLLFSEREKKRNFFVFVI